MSAAQRALEKLLRRDPRYKLEAYLFVRDALAYAHRTMLAETSSSEAPSAAASGSEEGSEEEEEKARHLTGQQLCEACRLFALDQYGYLARIVLANWGIHSTSDFGNVVYNLIEIKHMRKSSSDRREDFDHVYDFADAFEPRFELLAPEEAS